MQKHLDENRDKIAEGDRTELEAALKEAKEAVENNRDPKEGPAVRGGVRAAPEGVAQDGGGALDPQRRGLRPVFPTCRRRPTVRRRLRATTPKKDDVIDAEYTEGPKP